MSDFISDNFRFIGIFVLLFVAWRWLTAAVKASQRDGKTNFSGPWNAPAPASIRRAMAVDSLGLTSAVRASAIRAARQKSLDTSSQQSQTEVHMNPISALVFIIFVGGAVLSHLAGLPIGITIVLALTGIFLGYSIKMAQQWERAVILRLGKLQAVKGPGLFILIPIVDAVATWIDQRIRTTEVNAEQALTKDTVPVNVDAIVFWMVHDAERAALEIADYNSAVQRVAQTSLREMIGSSVLSELLSERKTADANLKEVIGAKTAEWGVTVNSVEIRDVAIPDNLQDAMSRQAQAEREKQARVILGSAEEEVAQKFVNAAKLYASSPEALQLRAMNIIYETTKERGATILMPTSMVDAMNPGAAAFALNMARTDAGQPASGGASVPQVPRTS
jgi:regulator of protease activity HflC (stomatin/prohibitin superfamily)